MEKGCWATYKNTINMALHFYYNLCYEIVRNKKDDMKLILGQYLFILFCLASFIEAVPDLIKLKERGSNNDQFGEELVFHSSRKGESPRSNNVSINMPLYGFRYFGKHMGDLRVGKI